eukprot:CAMPEP_0172775556 /NCGR_PEP_ID=MMETSP1074-20121228/198190_1 /TAXON_ID=2916 /ORGANISM="Ceratium fusus, Strain PA161109" /LENGTH=72 /DNA_ID=CAMNT_0013612189 /DNA_START=1 /DNA_END=219 /DNA_ORIENTATION=+
MDTSTWACTPSLLLKSLHAQVRQQNWFQALVVIAPSAPRVVQQTETELNFSADPKAHLSAMKKPAGKLTILT